MVQCDINDINFMVFALEIAPTHNAIRLSSGGTSECADAAASPRSGVASEQPLPVQLVDLLETARDAHDWQAIPGQIGRAHV